jgi:pyruvoyl-dependent arginine decarboxylase
MYDWHKKTGTAFITSGIGYGKTELSAFDAAELDANIISTNAVRVSSFVPPGWRILNSKQALETFTGNGAFLPIAYAHAVSNSNRLAASLLIGINKDGTKPSIITEHADVDVRGEQSLEQSMIALEDAFASRDWQIERTEKVTLEAEPRDGLHACVLVAVVFVVD